jgi:hypothetical protein
MLPSQSFLWLDSFADYHVAMRSLERRTSIIHLLDSPDSMGHVIVFDNIFG